MVLELEKSAKAVQALFCNYASSNWPLRTCASSDQRPFLPVSNASRLHAPHAHQKQPPARATACRHRKKLELARKRGVAAPPLPEDIDANILGLYHEVMADLTHKVSGPGSCCRAHVPPAIGVRGALVAPGQAECVALVLHVSCTRCACVGWAQALHKVEPCEYACLCLWVRPRLEAG